MALSSQQGLAYPSLLPRGSLQSPQPLALLDAPLWSRVCALRLGSLMRSVVSQSWQRPHSLTPALIPR